MIEGMRNIAPTGVRMSETLKAMLKKSAKDEGRSLNSEIVKRLERSLKQDGLLQV